MEVVKQNRRRSRKEDPLHRWCHDSLRLARGHTAKSPSLNDGCDAERLVDLAAFVKLIREKGIDSREVSRSLLVDSSTFDKLVESCPLGMDSAPESLSIIHETLVTFREDSNGGKKTSSRKSSGIHYTPPPVIAYILDHTLEPRLKSCLPETIASLTILDPACGCGNFLAGAYRRILDWALQWSIRQEPSRTRELVVNFRGERKLKRDWAASVLISCLYGVDLDAGAIEVARRILWLICVEYSVADGRDEHLVPMMDWCPHLQSGHALLGSAFGGPICLESDRAFHWGEQFPWIAARGGFDIIVGNPPYRRERDFKRELDAIAATDLGRYRSPRMDLWYYFVHRGVELLRDGGSLSFITNAYWLNGSGAEKLIVTFRDELHLDELFLLGDLPVFSGVTGQHVIFRATKAKLPVSISIKTIRPDSDSSMDTIFRDQASVRISERDRSLVFVQDGLNIRSLSQSLIDRMNRLSKLGELGEVRQGIAENPGVLNRRTIERFADRPESREWVIGEGVFSLDPREVGALFLNHAEQQLVRPYHELSDLGRYWASNQPSRRLIYSTRSTCPDLSSFPALHRHLARFRPIMEARRETLLGRNRWWQLHWPRDEALWKANKIVALQMAPRPSFVPTFGPSYVSFSANVFVPFAETREDIRYLTAILNSKIIWGWLIQHAKRRGIGLELNGHVLEQIPIPRVDFENSSETLRHETVVELVDVRMKLEHQRKLTGEYAAEIVDCETQLEEFVRRAYGLNSTDTEELDEMIAQS